MLEEWGCCCDACDHVVCRPSDPVRGGEMWKGLKLRAREGLNGPWERDFQRPGTKRMSTVEASGRNAKRQSFSVILKNMREAKFKSNGAGW